MQNYQKKRQLQSPENSNDITKVTRILESSIPLVRMSALGTTNDSVEIPPVLDKNGQLLLQSFREVLCKELDARFSNFCQHEFIPLKQDVICVKNDLGVFKDEVVLLKEQNAILASKLEKSSNQISHLERDARAHNLIFYNVTATANVYQSILDICRTVLKVSEPISITRSIVLKNHRSTGVLTVLVKFETVGMVYKILGGTKNLKNSSTRIGISRDLSEGERKIKSSLLSIRKLINEKDTSIKVKVVGKRMFVDNEMLIFNEKQNTFGNSQVNGKDFLMERFSINFDELVANNQ